MGIVGAIVIARWSWSLMRDTASVLLDASDEQVAGEVRDLLDDGPGGARITDLHVWRIRSEEHTSELQSLMRHSYAVLCLKKKKDTSDQNDRHHHVIQLHNDLS